MIVRICENHPYPPAWSIVGEVLGPDPDWPGLWSVATPELAGPDTPCWDGPTESVPVAPCQVEVAANAEGPAASLSDDQLWLSGEAVAERFRRLAKKLGLNPGP